MTIRIGISAGRPRPGEASFYPPGLPHREELRYVAERMNSVEINGSFYALQRRSSFETWAASVPEGFVFAVVLLWPLHADRLQSMRGMGPVTTTQ